MTEVQQPAAPVAPTKAAPAKLTPDEEKELYGFIGKCVITNTNFPGTTRWGVAGSMTVQELCNSNVSTLRDLGKKINEAINKHDPEFDGGDPIKIAGLAADRWVGFIRLVIRRKQYYAYLSDRKDQIKSLQATIDKAITPEEARRKAETELALLKQELGSEAE